MIRPAKRKSSFTVGLRCPDDGHLLHANGGAVPFASCRHCDGLWFTHDAIESRGAAALPKTGKRPRRSPAPRGIRSCPQCAVKLEAIDLADATIDECPSCGGVWLDSGEYRAACRHRMERRLDRYAPSLRPRTTRLGRILDRLNERIDVALEALEQLDEEPGPTRPSFPRRTRRQ